MSLGLAGRPVSPRIPRVASDPPGTSAVGSLPVLADFSQTRTDVERWRAGDRSAGDRLFRRYERGLLALIQRQIRTHASAAVRSRLSAEDLFQEAAATVLRKLRDFDYRGPGSLYAWMSALAAHAVTDAIDRAQAQKRHAGRERALAVGEATDSTGAPPQLAAAGHGPSTLAGHAEQHHRVHAALAELDDRSHRLITMRFFFGAEWAEIAEALGSPSADAIRKEAAGLLLRIAPRLNGV